MLAHLLDIAWAVSSLGMAVNIYILHRRVSRLERGGKR